jgi:hypothetical protein
LNPSDPIATSPWIGLFVADIGGAGVGVAVDVGRADGDALALGAGIGVGVGVGDAVVGAGAFGDDAPELHPTTPASKSRNTSEVVDERSMVPYRIATMCGSH